MARTTDQPTTYDATERLPMSEEQPYNDPREELQRLLEFEGPPAELQRLLDAHSDWLDGCGGQQLTDETAGSKFEGLRFDGLRLRKAKLHSVEWVRCSLVGVDLSQSDLEGSRFIGSCDLRGLVLDDAKIDFVVIGDSCQTDGMSIKTDTDLAKIPLIGSTLSDFAKIVKSALDPSGP